MDAYPCRRFAIGAFLAVLLLTTFLAPAHGAPAISGGGWAESWSDRLLRLLGLTAALVALVFVAVMWIRIRVFLFERPVGWLRVIATPPGEEPIDIRHAWGSGYAGDASKRARHRHAHLEAR
jgi:hypothetical protein